MDLCFKIEKQTLTRLDTNTVVNYSENYLKLDFTFSNEWDEVNKYIIIYHNRKATRLPLIEGSVVLSSTFLKSRKLVFMVYGVIVEDDEVVYRITTNNLHVDLVDCHFTTDFDNTLDPEVDADIVEQLQAEIDTKANSADLAVVATSGSYNDLEDKPELFSGSYNDLTDKPTLFSGDYNDLSNKPIIPVVVDTVADGNNNAVSSNAVYDYVESVIGNVNEWLTS